MSHELIPTNPSSKYAPTIAHFLIFPSSRLAILLKGILVVIIFTSDKSFNNKIPYNCLLFGISVVLSLFKNRTMDVQKNCFYIKTG
jgi:hypothetical protein